MGLKITTIKSKTVSVKLNVFTTLVCGLLLITPLTKSFAETSGQKRSNIQNKISSANKSLKKERSKSQKLAQKVTITEDKLNEISKRLHNTETKINTLTTNLNKSNEKKRKLLIQTNQQKDALAQQMQALYTSGKQSHLRLLLKQDNPSDISRTIKYYEYMNKHRLKKITGIQKQLDEVKLIQDQINTDTKTLNELLAKQSSRKTLLKKTVAEHESALKKQKRVVYSQEQKLSKLRKEESRLKGVIERLAQKRKKEEAEQKRQEQQKKLASQKKTPKATPKATQPKNTGTAVSRRYVPNKPFSSLKGRLSWPVKGRLTQKYGSNRNTKQKWKGVVISAPAGSNVYAIARGKVEYSGRLKGYGYLVIIRHDKNYRSLYAYNRSVYKKEGQIVKAGEVIAAVGNSGSQTNSGLYFEIRRGTTHHNPAQWCR
ncbi:murein hydrolase activator EnvC [Cocleimonas flava]|uniref:Septal ring factor EnvC (AmiA/AmiB activator) n=1 Tax=Cocleimonas flava TaxID=634765 RepID=A0A4V2P7S5_9GAMM|nr:septal ring factor EnvC (AmiA/AmiB activator) [Cocleimonas flava]